MTILRCENGVVVVGTRLPWISKWDPASLHLEGLPIIITGVNACLHCMRHISSKSRGASNSYGKIKGIRRHDGHSGSKCRRNPTLSRLASFESSALLPILPSSLLLPPFLGHL